MPKVGECRKPMTSGLTARLIFTTLIVSSLAFMAEAADDYNELGWVENPAALGTSKMSGPVCRGSFVWEGDESEVIEGKIRILADKAEKNGDYLELSGGVTMIAGNLTISSESALYEEQLQRVRLSGKVGFSSPQLIAKAFDATYQSKDAKNAQESAYSVELTSSVFSNPTAQLHGSGSSINYEDSVVIIKDARISFCEPTENTWHVGGKEVRLNFETMQGRARGAKFYLGKTPVLYLGYLPFPLGDKRQTGFLAPGFNYNSHNGFIYSQPVYLNIAANVDSTIYPQFLQKQGLLWEQDLRWLTAAGTGELGIGYINRDAVFGDARAAQYFKFSSVVNNGWSGEIDLAGISDDNYFRDLPSVLPSANDFSLPRFAHIRYANKAADWVLGVRDYQFIALNREDFFTPYTNIPYTQLSLFSNSAATGLYVENSLDYSSFGLDSNSTDDDDAAAGLADANSRVQVLTGSNSRLHNDFTIGWQAPFRWGGIHSRLNWQGVDYRISEEVLDSYQLDGDEPLRRNYYYFDTDAYLSFSRQINQAICQCYLTFEPRVYGLASRQDATDNIGVLDEGFADTGFFDATLGLINYDYLFTQRRYRGLDRYVAEERFSFGVESRLIDLAGKGVYAFRIGSIVSENINSDSTNAGSASSAEDNFANASNPWAMDLSFNLGDNNFFRLDVAGAADELHSQGMSFSHSNNKKSGVSLTYRQQEDKFYQKAGHQVANNFVWYLVPRWSLFGGWRYDLDEENLVSSVAGFGYENCCFSSVTGFFSRENNGRDDTGVMLQFSFTPLGSLGTTGNTGFATLAGGRIEDIYSEFR